MAVLDKFLSVRFLFFTTAFFAFQINLIAAKLKTASNNAKIRSSAHPNAGKQCPFFDGINTSVMRRNFKKRYHEKVIPNRLKRIYTRHNITMTKRKM